MSPDRLIRNAAFDPETTALLGKAFDEACREIGDQPSEIREVVAKRLIEAACRGERDMKRLKMHALQGLNRLSDAR